MKITKKVLLLLTVLGTTLMVATQIHAQIELPRITTACETKSGFLYAFNDGFSLRKKCSGKSRRVILIGEKGDKGDQGEQGPQGNRGPQGPTGVIDQSTITSFQNSISDLQARVTALEELHPIPTPAPTPVVITFADDKPAPLDTAYITIPSGYKSMTFNISATSATNWWAPKIRIGYAPYEQHRFSGGSQGTIPIIENEYGFRTGSSGENITVTATLNEEPDAKVLVLGKDVAYPYISQTFDTAGFNTITITVGGGGISPQNFGGISLQRFESGFFVEKEYVPCDGGAVCPLQTLPVLGGDYRVLLHHGTGTGAILGAILRP